MKNIATKVSRLTREIDHINKFFYEADQKGDPVLYASMLERKRDDIVRSIVLQLHTGTEDIINSLIECVALDAKPSNRKLRIKTTAGRALYRLLHGDRNIGFDKKLDLALTLGILREGTCKKLRVLNNLRNKCSHNWLLKVPVRHGKKPRQKKPPLLLFHGRDLHKAIVLEDFVSEFSVIYVKLFSKYLDFD